MDVDAEEAMWTVLQRFGLGGKKLAVYRPDDAHNIAEQVCHELGWICDGTHVEIVRSWLCRVNTDEPFQKRLRSDHMPESLHATLDDRFKVKPSTAAHVHVSSVAGSSTDIWKPLRVKHRAQDEQVDAKRKWEIDLKEKWSRELYIQLAAINAPILQGMDFCVGSERIHLALAGKTRGSTLKRYVKAWKACQLWKKSAWGEESFVHPGMFCEYLFQGWMSLVVLRFLGLFAKQSTGLRRWQV